ncbi:MAG: helix-turn-helix transcriptional regulator, partial [Roseburia sp.]|nr:helix-turn-helix transcriptional regulator [Roseburia sp.]
MTLINLLRERQLSVYQCAKDSSVPYTTLLDIVKGKTRIEKCTAETLYKLAKTLNVAMEDILEDCFRENENISEARDFEIYKSNICHLVKDKGDIDFIIDTLKENQIRIYWERKWYPESFYL